MSFDRALPPSPSHPPHRNHGSPSPSHLSPVTSPLKDDAYDAIHSDTSSVPAHRHPPRRPWASPDHPQSPLPRRQPHPSLPPSPRRSPQPRRQPTNRVAAICSPRSSSSLPCLACLRSSPTCSTAPAVGPWSRAESWLHLALERAACEEQMGEEGTRSLRVACRVKLASGSSGCWKEKERRFPILYSSRSLRISHGYIKTCSLLGGGY